MARTNEYQQVRRDAVTYKALLGLLVATTLGLGTWGVSAVLDFQREFVRSSTLQAEQLKAIDARVIRVETAMDELTKTVTGNDGLRMQMSSVADLIKAQADRNVTQDNELSLVRMQVQELREWKIRTEEREREQKGP